MASTQDAESVQHEIDVVLAITDEDRHGSILRYCESIAGRAAVTGADLVDGAAIAQHVNPLGGHAVLHGELTQVRRDHRDAVAEAFAVDLGERVEVVGEARDWRRGPVSVDAAPRPEIVPVEEDALHPAGLFREERGPHRVQVMTERVGDIPALAQHHERAIKEIAGQARVATRPSRTPEARAVHDADALFNPGVGDDAAIHARLQQRHLVAESHQLARQVEATKPRARAVADGRDVEDAHGRFYEAAMGGCANQAASASSGSRWPDRRARCTTSQK